MMKHYFLIFIITLSGIFSIKSMECEAGQEELPESCVLRYRKEKREVTAILFVKVADHTYHKYTMTKNIEKDTYTFSGTRYLIEHNKSVSSPITPLRELEDKLKRGLDQYQQELRIK